MRADPRSALGSAVQPGFLCRLQPRADQSGRQDKAAARYVKVVAGSTAQAADVIEAMYGTIIPAGTYRAPSIQIAEAAKVIENTQRDLNIALMNELAIIFNRLGLDTEAVLKAAGTKWNFLPFRPGLVGGHCISVDPYYLTHKAEKSGYLPQIILAGRRLNDGMGAYVAGQLVKAMLKKRLQVNGARVLVLGLHSRKTAPICAIRG